MGENMNVANKISILGFQVFCGDKDGLADTKGVINTINPHSYVISRKDETFRKALEAADHLLPDGTGITIAARILAGQKISKIAGSDLHETLLKSLNEKKGSCYYLGSSETTLNLIRERLEKEYPGVRSAFFSPPFRDTFTEEENETMINAVNDFSPDVLFVGMTAPKQERWVHENRGKLNASLICCIGAAFDFYAGTVKRSGQFWINAGLEWLPRLIREPKRLWRRNFVSTPLFLWYVFREKIQRFKDSKIQRLKDSKIKGLNENREI
jgi:N-acetylglucosaminyldiphosphoundecaprenol N-acetyl-beta-D-mannosaminyltransferase